MRILGAFSGLARATGDTLAAAGRGVAGVLGLGSTTAPAKPALPPPSMARVPPGRRVYAVGDIHGRADLLTKLLDELRADARVGEYQGRPILIFLGDYVDRGFQSKDVINILLSN